MKHYSVRLWQGIIFEKIYRSDGKQKGFLDFTPAEIEIRSEDFKGFMPDDRLDGLFDGPRNCFILSMMREGPALNPGSVPSLELDGLHISGRPIKIPLGLPAEHRFKINGIPLSLSVTWIR